MKREKHTEPLQRGPQHNQPMKALQTLNSSAVPARAHDMGQYFEESRGTYYGVLRQELWLRRISNRGLSCNRSRGTSPDKGRPPLPDLQRVARALGWSLFAPIIYNLRPGEDPVKKLADEYLLIRKHVNKSCPRKSPQVSLDLLDLAFSIYDSS